MTTKSKTAPAPAAASRPVEVVDAYATGRVEALESENARLRREAREAERIVNPAGIAGMGPPPPVVAEEPTTATVPLRGGGRGNTAVIGTGKYLWRGSLPADPTAPQITFRCDHDHKMLAAGEYLKHASIRATIHPISMELLASTDAPATPAAE